MKLRHVLILVTLTTFALLTQSCVTSETTVTSPDGTVTVTKTTGPDAASVIAAGGIVAVAGKIIVEK